MRFAQIAFRIGGIFGVLVITPMYFLFDEIGRRDPPPLTHPQFYYGFLGVVLSWSVAFFVIASDPVRFRPLMIPSILEKLGYVVTIGVLCAVGQVPLGQSVLAVPDLLLAILFTVSYWKTKP